MVRLRMTKHDRGEIYQSFFLPDFQDIQIELMDGVLDTSRYLFNIICEYGVGEDVDRIIIPDTTIQAYRDLMESLCSDSSLPFHIHSQLQYWFKKRSGSNLEVTNPSPVLTDNTPIVVDPTWMEDSQSSWISNPTSELSLTLLNPSKTQSQTTVSSTSTNTSVLHKPYSSTVSLIETSSLQEPSLSVISLTNTSSISALLRPTPSTSMIASSTQTDFKRRYRKRRSQEISSGNNTSSQKENPGKKKKNVKPQSLRCPENISDKIEALASEPNTTLDLLMNNIPLKIEIDPDIDDADLEAGVKNLTNLLKNPDEVNNLNSLLAEETIVSDILDQGLSTDLEIAETYSVNPSQDKKLADLDAQDEMMEEIFGDELDKDKDPDFVPPLMKEKKRGRPKNKSKETIKKKKKAAKEKDDENDDIAEKENRDEEEEKKTKEKSKQRREKRLKKKIKPQNLTEEQQAVEEILPTIREEEEEDEDELTDSEEVKETEKKTKKKEKKEKKDKNGKTRIRYRTKQSWELDEETGLLKSDRGRIKDPGPPGKNKKVNKTGEKKPSQCTHCGKIISTAYGLMIHEKVMHFRKPEHKCTLCDKVFVLDKYLKMHVKAVHTENLGIVCDLCGDVLRTKKGLRLHMLVHEEDNKVHQCGQCDKSFRHKHVLRKHVLKMHVWTASDKTQCEICNRFFKHTEGLNRHMKTVHTTTFPYHCKHCPEKYAFNYDLNKHMKKVHPDNLSKTPAKVSAKGMRMPIPPGMRVPGLKNPVTRPSSNPLFTINTDAGVVHLYTEDMDVKPNINEIII